MNDSFRFCVPPCGGPRTPTFFCQGWSLCPIPVFLPSDDLTLISSFSPVFTPHWVRVRGWYRLGHTTKSGLPCRIFRFTEYKYGCTNSVVTLRDHPDYLFGQTVVYIVNYSVGEGSEYCRRREQTCWTISIHFYGPDTFEGPFVECCTPLGKGPGTVPVSN